MPPSPAPKNHSRLVVVVIALLTACFLASSLYPQIQARAISSAAMDIALNGAPSIERLTLARADLHQMNVALHDYLDARADGEQADAAPVSALQARMHAHLEGYFVLPTFPGEREHWEQLHRTVEELDGAVARSLETAGGESAAERKVQTAVLRVRRGAVDESMTELVEFNARQIRDLAMVIRRAHARTLVLTIALDLVAVALAGAAAVLLGGALRRLAAVEAENARLLALRADELESFAGRIAHDVRNPLTAVSLSLAKAARAEDLSDARRSIERAGRSLERAADIIRDLLEFARAGAHPPPGARADLPGVVAGVVADLRPVADERGVTLNVDAIPPCVIACAPGILTSLLSNLVHNAIKYIGDGPERSVTIRGLLRDHVVRIEVTDTGPGVAPGLLGVIFEPFVRGDGDQVGLGLGLATVKRICGTHGGRVGVESEPGHGALFWAELPVLP